MKRRKLAMEALDSRQLLTSVMDGFAHSEAIGFANSRVDATVIVAGQRDPVADDGPT